jgi:hypothetical protein
LSRLLNGELHGPGSHHWPRTVITIQGDRSVRFLDYLQRRSWVHQSGGETIREEGKPHDTLTLDPGAIGGYQHVRDLRGILGRHAEPFENLASEVVELSGMDEKRIGHSSEEEPQS